MSIQPSDFDPVRKLAHAGRWREARERYARILRKAGSDWRPYYMAGMIEASGGDFDRAAKALEKARAQAPAEPQIIINLAQVHLHRGLPAEALKLLDPLAGRFAENAAVQKLYGTALLEVGRHDEAAPALERALRQGDDPAVLNNLALIYRGQGDLHRATTVLERAARGGDDGIEVQSNLASIYVATGRHEDARILYDKLSSSGASDPRALRALAVFSRDTGHADRAIRLARRALILDPSQVASYTMLAELLDRTSALEAALSVARRGVCLEPEKQHLVALEGRALRRLKRFGEAVSCLQGALEGAVSGPDTYRLGFELAQSLDSLGRYDDAFCWFESANRTQIKEFRGGYVDPGRAFAEVGALTAAFRNAPSWAGAVPQDRAGEADPVFLVGFPRSGTTLLDQVLDAHPGVQVLEEHPLISGLSARLASKAGYPGALENLSEEMRAEMRAAYFTERDRFLVPSEGAVYIDKMPLNIVHAGLIMRIFPKARFILALRHPCDVCLSCLMQNFTLNHSMAVFCSLPDTARFYREVFGLWQLYAEHLNPGVVTVKYEDMTRDLRAAAEPVLHFLGLDWDDRVMQFHEHARQRGHISTPSYAQVTQPLYGHAVARWKRYGAAMEAVAGELRPQIEAFGYGDESNGAANG
ncbi:tetratricopeptide repeat-containing sulfotransferase family protein [Roseovarius sp.]|uniref:tetratricopeptide repeat-containing sulfotransferase family protein n=1 Tax=Roseovarius sp. TaxID=1486281 RepID=UPI003A97443E